MNIFERTEGILGKVESAHLKRTQQEFFELAYSIRKQLGRQAYLLDRYLFDLLNAIGQTLAHDAADRGFGNAWELSSLCKEIIGREESSKEHPFYEKAKYYIEEHPLSLQEQETKLDFYLAALADDFLAYMAPFYFENRKDVIQDELDIVCLRDLYRKNSTIIGSEEQMEKLNLLIRQRFMVTTTMASFVQGATNSLLHSLTFRDMETHKTVIQLILEEMDNPEDMP